MASKIIFVIACVFVGASYGMYSYSTDIPDDYPTQLFEAHLLEKKLNLLNRYEGESLEEENDDEINCATRTKVVQPYTVKIENKLKFVVQSSSFSQWVKTTECLNLNAECFNLISKPKSFKTSCVQTYSTIKLYLYDPELKEYQHGSFEFPACCSCSFKNF